MSLTGYQDAMNPITKTIDSMRRISVGIILTGYEEIINDPVPGKVIILNFICIQQIITPNIEPIIAPKIDINQPSKRKIYRIIFEVAPILFRMNRSSFLSMISIDKLASILKEAIININTNIR